MKKFICLLIIFVFTVCAAQSVTLSGGVSYTVNEARQIAFDGVPKKIDMSKYKEYFVDKNFEKNMKLLNEGKTRYRGRILAFFSNQTYSVCYTKNRRIAYYYSKIGLLEFIDITYKETFPQKSVTYDINGNIDSVVLSVSVDEQFIFDTNGKLGVHWIGKNGYDENGIVFGVRNFK